MRKANRKVNGLVFQRLAEAQMSPYDRERAMHAIKDADAIVDTIVWVRDKVAAASALLLKPGLKH